MEVRRWLKRCLLLLGILCALGIVEVHGFPPSARGQNLDAVNEHLRNTDANVIAIQQATQRNWQRIESERSTVETRLERDESDHSDLRTKVEVMYSNLEQIKWFAGMLVVIFGGHLSLTWKAKKA